jgi:hypothetical protein
VHECSVLASIIKINSQFHFLLFEACLRKSRGVRPQDTVAAPKTQFGWIGSVVLEKKTVKRVWLVAYRDLGWLNRSFVGKHTLSGWHKSLQSWVLFGKLRRERVVLKEF